MSAELGVGGEHGYLPILQNVTHAESDLKQLLVPRLLAELRSWPSAFTDETGPRWLHHLDQVLSILDETNSEADRDAVTQECTNRYEVDPAGTLALVWLRGLFRFDAVRGTQALIRGLTNRNDPGTHERAIEMFAALFGDRDAVVLEITDSAQHARLLGQLVRYAYTFVRPEDDQVHEGGYTPDARDKAESARNFLLSKLLDTPGPEARNVVLELANEDEFARVPDRLRLQARQRAAADAEFPPYAPEDVLALDTRHEAPPRDSDGLFAVMMDRLDDLAHELAHHDFSDRRTLQGIKEEPEMQRTLALRICAKANGAYVMTREDEVADEKQPDIRLSAVNGGHKAVVEVKIADNRWSLTALERALRDQLVGRYLRHTTCRVGCLLLTYHGRKHYWVHPETGRHIKFSEVVAFLSEKARGLEEETLHDVRTGVYGLDLTDPPLPP